MTDPSAFAHHAISVTIRYGTTSPDTQVTFVGHLEDVRDDLTAFFGLDCESESSLALSDLVVNATQIAHGVGALARTLGATAISTHRELAADDPWRQATAAAPRPIEPKNPLVERIEHAPDLPALKRLWAENQAAFSDSQVMDAWKARGRALTTN